MSVTPAIGGEGVETTSHVAHAERVDRGRVDAVLETAVLLVVLDVAVAANGVWLAQVVALAWLLILPGYLALRALRLRLPDMTRSPGWIPATSLVVLTATSLAVDLLGPIVGIDRPLSTWPLALAVNAVCIGLALLPGPGTPAAAAASAWRALDRRATWTLLVPVLAAVATLRLNNGNTDVLPVVAASAAVALLAASLWNAHRWSTQRLCWTLTTATLALMLGYSLRSSYVFGWDISAEYSLLRNTIADGVWSTSHQGDAYGAMLSLTALPALLHSVTGVSALVILKLVYPALFSLVPAIVMVLLRTVLSRRVALIGAALLLTQLSFISEMPALARQEIAIFLEVSVLAAMIDNRLRTAQRLFFLVLLTAGMVVSHYSTTYTLLTVVGGAIVVQLLVGHRHGAPRVDPRKVVVFVTAAIVALGWYQGVTNSTAHTMQTVSTLVESGFQVLPSADGESPLAAYLRGPKPPRTVSVEEYQADIESEFAREKPWLVPVPGATDSRWALQPAEDPPDPTRLPLLQVGANLAALVFSQLLVLITIIGTAALVIRRRVSGPLLDFAILSVSSIAALAVVRLSAAIALAYGQDRLYMQLLPIVAVPFLWSIGGAWTLVDRAGMTIRASLWKHVRLPLRRLLSFGVGAYLVLLVAMSAGLVQAAAGSHSPANLSDGGEHYTRFFVTAPEVAAAEWLGRVQPMGSLTYADGHAQLRIFGYGKPKGPILTDLAPGIVDLNAWVYGSRFNTVIGETHSFFGSQWIVYRFPREFLADKLGVAYTNGSSEVFHR